MKSFFLLIIGLLTTTCTFANPTGWSATGSLPTTYKHAEMGSLFGSLKALKTLPVREAGASQVDPGGETLTNETYDIFTNIQTLVFGKSLIEVKPCLDCYALADYASKTIYIQPTYVRTMMQNYGEVQGRQIVEFMIAHELSHFIHEISIGKGSLPNQSINGNPSLFVHGASHDNSAEGGRRSHAEIDYYAFLILRKLNRDSPLEITRSWFNDTIDEMKSSGNPDDLDVVLEDLANRTNNAEAVIRYLWEK